MRARDTGVNQLSPYGMDQKRSTKRTGQPQAWHAGDGSSSPEQGKACKLAGVTHAWQARPLSARIPK